MNDVALDQVPSTAAVAEAPPPEAAPAAAPSAEVAETEVIDPSLVKSELERLGQAAFDAFKKRLGRDKYPRLADSFAEASPAQKQHFIFVALSVCHEMEKGPLAPDLPPEAPQAEPPPAATSPSFPSFGIKGCLACNEAEVSSALMAIGLPPHQLSPVPPDVVAPNAFQCPACKQNWILQGSQP